MEDDSEFSDDGMMPAPGNGVGSQVVRKQFFQRVSVAEPVIVNVPPDDNWRLVVTQVTPASSFRCHAVKSQHHFRFLMKQACLGEFGAPEGCRVVLKAGLGKATTVVGHFRGNQVEHVALGG